MMPRRKQTFLDIQLGNNLPTAPIPPMVILIELLKGFGLLACVMAFFAMLTMFAVAFGG